MHTLSWELGLWLLSGVLKKRFLPHIPACESGLVWGPALFYLLKALSPWLPFSGNTQKQDSLSLPVRGWLGGPAHHDFPECVILIFSPVITSLPSANLKMLPHLEPTLLSNMWPESQAGIGCLDLKSPKNSGNPSSAECVYSKDS